MKVGLSEGLDVGMSGGGDGMLGGLWRANGTRIPSGRFWTIGLGVGCRTAGNNRRTRRREIINGETIQAKW